MVSNAQKLNNSSSFANFIKSKWRSSAKDKTSRHSSTNSAADIERDWVRHSALKLALNSNYQAPIHDLLKGGGSEVLDIGCGAGFWTNDMAAQYPISHFTGIDIDKNIFPNNATARNVVFQRVDLLQLPLPYEDNTFDLIFMRCMVDIIPDEAWDALLSELARIMKKGGYIECVEAYPDLLDAGPATNTIMQLINQTPSNIPQQPGSPTATMMQNPLPNRIATMNQLKGMQIKHIHTPVGRYGGAVGSLLLEHWERVIQSSRQKWVQNKLITEKQLAATIKDFQEEVEQRQTYMSWYIVMAQKIGYRGPIIKVEDYDSLLLQG